MLRGAERRKTILKNIKESDKPVVCSRLAEICGVSRQVIVQDVALLRAEGHDIISTNNGYILHSSNTFSRNMKMQYDSSQTEDEMFTIVDLGGTIKSITVESPVYGKVEAFMNITSRAGAKSFLKTLQEKNCKCLESIIDGPHYHTIEAESEELLDNIENELSVKGYLFTE